MGVQAALSVGLSGGSARHGVVVAYGSLLAGLLVAATPPSTAANASAASPVPAWGPAVAAPGKVSAAQQMDLAFGADGSQVVAWVETLEEAQQVMVTVRAPGADVFAAPVTVAESKSFGLADPSVVVDDHDRVTVVWAHRAEHGVWAAQGRVGAMEFDDPLPIDTAAPDLLRRPRVVVDEQGRVTAVWESVTETVRGRTFSIDSATWLPTDGLWSEPDQVSPQGVSATWSDLAVDATGRVTATWRAGGRVQAASKAAGGPFGSVLDLSPADGTASVPRIAAGGARTVVAWALQAKGAEPEQAQARSLAGGLPTGPAEAVGDVADIDDELAVAVDPSGTAWVAWLKGSLVAVARGEIGQAFDDAVTFDEGSPQWPLMMAAGADGAVTLVWSRVHADGFQLRSLRSAADASLGAPVDLTGATPGLADWFGALATDDAGHVGVAWARFTAEDFAGRVHASVLDPIGPDLEVAVPTTVEAGSPTSLRATARDRWSGPATVAWGFGDGTTSTGASPSHTYARPGTYTVRVTATDAAGNASAPVTRSITVVDATAPVLTRVRLDPRRLPTGHGARLGATCSEAATLTGAVQRQTRGGEWRRFGTKAWRLAPGRSTKVFYGKAKQRRMPTGDYRVRFKATDAAGNVSATVTRRFAVQRG